MANKILNSQGTEFRTVLPKIKGVHPHGSKILIEILKADEVMGTSLHISDTTEVEGAPQAIVIETGPCLPAESGIKNGDRIYWTGKGTQVIDPRSVNNRIRALVEVNNVLAIIEEEK